MKTREIIETQQERALTLENKYVVTAAVLLTFLTGFAGTELLFRLLFGRI